MDKQKASSTGLSFFMLTALVTGNMIGSGVFLLPAALASFGSIGIVGWLCTAIGAMFLALVFSSLAAYKPQVGGPYAYCRDAYGDFIGFIVAYNYWLAIWIGNAAIVVAMVGYLGHFFPVITGSSLLSVGLALLIVWGLTAINLLGVHTAGIVQLISTVLKLLPLVLIAVVGLFYIHPEHFMAFNVTGQSNYKALSGACALTLWSFIGVESASIPADDVENARVMIPRATIVGTLIATAVYIFSTIAVMGVIPMDTLAQSTAPYADAATLMLGTWGGALEAAGAVISCFGALNGWILLQGQIPMAAAQDNLFPKAFAGKNARHAPSFALCISSVLISGLLLLTINKTLVDKFTFIISLAIFATLIPYLLSSVSELIMRIKADDVDAASVVRLIFISSCAFAYSYWAIFGTGAVVVFDGVLLFFSGIPIYAFMQWREHKAR